MQSLISSLLNSTIFIFAVVVGVVNAVIAYEKHKTKNLSVNIPNNNTITYNKDLVSTGILFVISVWAAIVAAVAIHSVYIGTSSDIVLTGYLIGDLLPPFMVLLVMPSVMYLTNADLRKFVLDDIFIL